MASFEHLCDANPPPPSRPSDAYRVWCKQNGFCVGTMGKAKARPDGSLRLVVRLTGAEGRIGLRGNSRNFVSCLEHPTTVYWESLKAHRAFVVCVQTKGNESSKPTLAPPEPALGCASTTAPSPPKLPFLSTKVGTSSTVPSLLDRSTPLPAAQSLRSPPSKPTLGPPEPVKEQSSGCTSTTAPSPLKLPPQSTKVGPSITVPSLLDRSTPLPAAQSLCSPPNRAFRQPLWLPEVDCEGGLWEANPSVETGCPWGCKGKPFVETGALLVCTQCFAACHQQCGIVDPALANATPLQLSTMDYRCFECISRYADPIQSS